MAAHSAAVYHRLKLAAFALRSFTRHSRLMNARLSDARPIKLDLLVEDMRPGKVGQLSPHELKRFAAICDP